MSEKTKRSVQLLKMIKTNIWDVVWWRSCFLYDVQPFQALSKNSYSTQNAQTSFFMSICHVNEWLGERDIGQCYEPKCSWRKRSRKSKAWGGEGEQNIRACADAQKAWASQIRRGGWVWTCCSSASPCKNTECPSLKSFQKREMQVQKPSDKGIIPTKSAAAWSPSFDAVLPSSWQD